MAKKTPPEVHLQLAGGSLKIETPEVIYHISATASAAAQSLPAPVEKAPLLLEVDEKGELYKDLSEEMYQGLGNLARRLAVSLRDLRVDPSELDLVASGERLENAKGELASVVDMTEKATMNIMDLTDKIQTDCQAAQNSLSTLQDVQVMEPSERDGFLELLDRLVEAQRTARPLLGQALSQAEETLVFLAELDSGPEPQSLGAGAAKSEAGQRVVFPLNDLFQILYELCANDDVKKNIKAIWNKMDEFDEAKVNETLRQGADDFERDEEFVMVPLEPLFKSLFLSTDNKPFKETIKKLNSARAQLFLDQSLPVEVRYEEAPAEVEEAPPPEAKEAEAAPEPEKAEAEPVPEPEEAPAKVEQDDVEALLAEGAEAEAEPPAKEEPEAAAAEPLGQDDVEALLAGTGGA
ncbi:MAG: protein phosphatase CheZ, partial [Deltaproteobacteria bacterium]|nr:protein phosphatase CheZ [Deltaproteobacteria bacterium]